MPSVPTLQQIEAAQADLSKMIAAFKAAPAAFVHVAETKVQLHPGEHYAGLLLDSEGRPSHHLVLLAGDAEELTWPKAVEWAKAAGGDLPTRPEQALLFANLKVQFEKEWYWSSQEHEDNSSCAWTQAFSNGLQSYTGKSAQQRARAVRRLTA
jgi:hypothetical protein